MAWQQLHLILDDNTQTAAIETQLENLGALSITCVDAADNPIFEPKLGDVTLWQQTQLTALFAVDNDVMKIANQLKAEYPAIIASKIESLADQDWQRMWLEYFKPMQFAKNLWVIPSGYDIPDSDAVNIFLDPGLAFGTGTHPTTAMCLQWLAEHELDAKCVIDYGCGSGILAIAALKLGAKEVWAIDYDPQALTATRENAKRNAIDLQKLHIGENTALPETYQADIIFANILAQPLIELAPLFAAHLKNHGDLVLSGILQTQAASILTAYQHNNFVIKDKKQQEDWLCLSGKKSQQFELKNR